MATVIDNLDAGFSKVGTWVYYTGQGINNDVDYSIAGTGVDQVTWNFGAVAAGNYTIEVHWSSHTNRATDTPYTVYHKGVVSLPDVSNPIVAVADNIDEDGGANADCTTIDVNQEQLNDGSTGGAGESSGYLEIGIYTADGVNDFKVILTDNANEYVIADAIRITLISGEKTFTADGVVLSEETQTFTVDGVVKETLTEAFTADGIVEEASDWYNANWSYRVKVTIQASKVDADLVDYPVYVALADLPAGFHANVNQTDGRDIRVTTDDGVTEVPREVVFYDLATDTGELHFKGDVADATDTDFYIYYGNPSATEPAKDATYGSGNTWNSNYLAVFHLQEAVNTGASGYKDSTNNNNHGTGVSMAITAPDGKLAGKAAEFDGAADRIGSIPRLLTNNTWSITAWAYVHALSGSAGNPIYYQHNGTSDLGQEFGLIDEYPGAGDQTYFARSGGATLATGNDVNWAINTWYHHGATFNNTAVNFFFNGGDGGSGTVSGGTPPDELGCIAAWYNYADASRYLDGIIDEVRITDNVLVSTWISTEYNNQSDTSTFYSAGAQESASLTETFTVDGLVASRGTKTFTSDGIVKETQTEAFTADGVVKQILTKTFTADGVVKAVTTKTFTVDGIVRETKTFAFTIDGVVRETKTFTFTIDGLVKATQSTTFTADGIVLQEGIKTFTIDGTIRGFETETFTIDGIIFASNIKEFTVDGVVGVASTYQFTADGLIRLFYYRLGEAIIPRPDRLIRGFVSLKTDMQTLTGKLGRDISYTKEKYQLGWDNLTKADADRILSIINLNQAVNFEVNAGLLRISPVSVIPNVVSKQYTMLGNDYRVALVLELIEEII